MLLHHAEQDFVLDDDWVLELKYDGIRAIVDTRDPKDYRIWTRRGVDITFQFPEVKPPAGHIWDGEIVGFDENGFHKLNYVQRRMGIVSRDKVLERMKRFPIKFVAFDVLNHPEMNLRTRLDVMAQHEVGPGWDKSPVWPAKDIDKLWAYVKSHNLEGLVAKRLDSKYVEGQRTYSWRKIKHDKPEYRSKE
jgi:bifunctional non-homologous end joining protein LigD